MVFRLLIFLLLCSTFVPYLEWGMGSSTFIIQSEVEVLSKLFKEPGAVMHPFIIIPLIGQFILLFVFFQKKPAQWLLRAGILAVGLLVVFILFIGLFTFNWKMVFSALPFVVLALWTLWLNKIESKRVVRPKSN